MSGWKVGDLEPALAGTYTSADVPTSLEAAFGVVLHVTRPDTTILTRAVTRMNQTTDPGEWTLALVTNDLNTRGTYVAKLVVEWTSGRKQTTDPVGFYVGA